MQIKHDDMCEVVQRFGEQLAAAGAFLQEAWSAQAAQLQTEVWTLFFVCQQVAASQFVEDICSLTLQPGR